MPTRIVIASGNPHKAEEIQALLGDDFECRTLKDYPDAVSYTHLTLPTKA